MIIVTGGLGFIGTHLVLRLLEKGYDVTVIDKSANTPPPLQRLVDDGEIRVVRSDYCSVADGSLWRRGAAVIHLAAIADPAEAHMKPLETTRINAYCTARLLEQIRGAGIPVIYASSASIYGVPRYTPIDEDHPRDPIGIYGASKLAGELYLAAYNREYGVPAASLRLFNVYGPWNRKGVVYSFIEKMVRGEPPIIYGGGGQIRDFIYIDDVVDAFIKALRLRETSYTAVNIGSGRGISIRELYTMLSRITGYRGEPVYAEPRGFDIDISIASIKLAREKLGWEPRTPLEEGLRRTVEWYLETLKVKG